MFVFNNTKVIPARLFGRRKETGGKVEALLLTPKGNDVWEILVNPGRKALPGQGIEFQRISHVLLLIRRNLAADW